MTVLRSGKAGWVGSGNPDEPHFNVPRLRVVSGAAETFLKMPVPADPGENVTVADLALTVASSAATGSVTFTLRRVAERVPWSNLTWQTAPGVTGASVTAVISDPAEGDVVTFDIAALAQFAVDGPHYGWRLTSSSGSVTRFYGFDTDAGPSFDFAATEAPARATDLVPNGIGSLAKPVLQWTPADLNGGDAQTGFRVQIATTASPTEDADGIWTSPAYDSGTVVDPAAELDLSATAYAGVSAGSGFYWQVLWLSETGLWSPVSDTAHYERETKPTWTFVNPTGGEVDSTRPTFEATFSGDLSAWRARLALASKPHQVIAGSGKQQATADEMQWQPLDSVYIVGQREPVTLQDGEDYILTLEGWRDGEGYVASAGDPIAVEASVTFTVNEDTGITAPTMVSADQHATLPVNVITITRPTAPDALVLYRNGRAVATVDAADAHTTGTTYVINDALGKPMRQATYAVRAQVDGAGISALSGTDTATLVPKGVWFISADLEQSVQLGGPPPSMRRSDEAGVYVTQGDGEEVDLVVIRSGRGKVDDTYTGQLAPRAGERSAQDQMDDLEAMWESSEPVYLIAGNVSKRVRILDLQATADEYVSGNRNWSVVSVRHVEVG